MKSREEIYADVLKSSKYNSVSSQVIKRIVDEEFSKFKSNKLCVKSVKNKLHQIHGIFLESKSNKKAFELLNIEDYDGILKLHVSTLERELFYQEFYNKIFNITGVPKSIIDLACGYNPFSIKYMNLKKGFKYYAYDINEETNILLNAFFKRNNYNGQSKVLDLSQEMPKDEAEVAFLFKFLPLIEKQNKTMAKAILTSLNCKYIVVSFPTKTVSGKLIGMEKNYAENFNTLIKDEFKILGKFSFSNELVFVIRKMV